jgi:transposase
VRRIDELFAI